MDIVIIANAWTAATDNPTGKHQLALQLANKGHRVLWIEGSGMRRPRAGNAADRTRIMHKCARALSGYRKVKPNITVASPLILPFPESRIARHVNAFIYRLTVRTGIMLKQFHNPVLINFLPIIPSVLRRWRGRSVYYCVDRWECFSTYNATLMRMLDQECCRCAKHVFATSEFLFRRCKSINPDTTLIGHGVDYEHFSKGLHSNQGEGDRPCDLPAGKLVGFFGLLSEWVDQALLVKLADALEPMEARLVLIGAHDTDISHIQKTPTIILLGPKPYQELPAYAARFTVGIIPFAVTPLTEAVNPVKLREMLAAGCPVIATELPDVQMLSESNPFVVATNTHESFIAAVCERIATPPDQATRQAISQTVQNETWAAKTEAILDILNPSEIK